MECEKKDIIIYRTHDGKASVALFAKDGKVWLNQKALQNFLPPLSNPSADI